MTLVNPLSDDKDGKDRSPFASGTLEDRLTGWVMKLAGAALVALSVAGWLTLLSWSASDPSLTHATGTVPRNWLGPIGAILSDLSLQTFGLTAIFAYLVPMYWGVQLITREYVPQIQLKLLLFPVAILALAAALSSLPLVKSWPLNHGFGGIVGDLVLGLATSLLSVVNPARASIAAGMMFFAGGFAALFAALGLTQEDFKLLWDSKEARKLMAAEARAKSEVLRVKRGDRDTYAEMKASFVGAMSKAKEKAQATAESRAASLPAASGLMAWFKSLLPRDVEKPTMAGPDPGFCPADAEQYEAGWGDERGGWSAGSAVSARKMTAGAGKEARDDAGQSVTRASGAAAASAVATAGGAADGVGHKIAGKGIGFFGARSARGAGEVASARDEAGDGRIEPQLAFDLRPGDAFESDRANAGAAVSAARRSAGDDEAEEIAGGKGLAAREGAVRERAAREKAARARDAGDIEVEETDDATGTQPREERRERAGAAIAKRFAPRRSAVDSDDEDNASQRAAADAGASAKAATPGQVAATVGAGLAGGFLSGITKKRHRNGGYRAPSLKLLKRQTVKRPGPEFTNNVLRGNARLLEDVLGDFGIKGKIKDIKPGPVVTLFELEPARGTKSSRVIALADDIARSMSAASARIAVVPGRNIIGIELPNMHRETVLLRELLETEGYRNSAATLPLTLGRSISGEPVIADLARMPHLLVAGTTGSGKSVGVNAMIMSLLYKKTPEDCRFLMIDPKMLELSVYNGIPHLLCPVVTDPQKAVKALAWVVAEMEERYKRMSQLGVRNIDVFNNRLRNAAKRGEVLARRVHTGFDALSGEAIFESEEFDHKPMPYIVVVVDEFADLMTVAGKEIEGLVQRLAQMARAAGIHLIMATQRPSVDVITGTIKANFPTRISFKVTSKIDSRTILNEQGAEQLLGHGDMLYAGGMGQTERVHGALVLDEEVEAIASFLREQGEPDYVSGITDGGEDGDAAGGGNGEAGGGSSAVDELYDRAVAIVVRDQKASTSYIQRRLSIGYNKAANLIERMEEDGIVGPSGAGGKRQILVPTGG